MMNWQKIEEKLKEVIITLHDELGWFNDEELENTPRRITNFYKEWADNYDFKFTKFESNKYDQLIVLKDIRFQSLCSHHMLPFHGSISIGYLPDKEICGVSKLVRTVKKISSKPQIQEGMTQEIADFIFKQLKPKFVMVVIKAEHLCMIMRGVKNKGEMVTSAIRWNKEIEPNPLKDEFLSLLER